MIDCIDQLERQLTVDSRTAVLLRNLHRSIESGHLTPKVGASFCEALDRRRTAHLTKLGSEPSSHDLRQLAISAFEEIYDAKDLEPLHTSFQATHGTSLDFGRIVTQMTLRERYVDEPTEVDSFGMPVSMDPHDDLMTDSEFERSSIGVSSSPFRLRQSFSLCPEKGVAFITDLSGLDSCTEADKEAKADRAAEFLGLAYDDGESLALLRISSTSINDWTMIRRPTLFDALDHWWWMCWPDDPQAHGHTLDLAGLAGQPPELRKGGCEWVINDQSVEADNNKVVAVLLGRTLRSTKAEVRSDLWHTFCNLLDIGAPKT